MDVKYDLSSYRRVLELASTPDWEEFSRVAAIALVGVIGFVIFAFMSFLPGGV